MQLHFPTLLVAMVLLSTTLALVVGALAWRSRHDGLPQLTIALALHAVTYGLVMLRGSFDDTLLLAAGNVAMTAGFAMVNEAICRFQQRAPARWLLWAPPLAALALQPWLMGQTTGRVVTVAVLVGGQCVTALALLLQRRRATVGFGQYLLGANFLAVSGILAYRAIVVAQAGPLPAMHETLQRVQSLSFALGAMTTVVMAMGFVVMTREAADERNRILAMEDELTGLGNRRTLLEVLGRQAAQSQRTGLPLSVLVIDIDRFKAVNDEFGHFSGDAAIRGVARAMHSRLRRQDVLGRLGGEEFLAILAATPGDGARVIAERLREAVEAGVFETADGRRMALTVSIGLHEFHPDAEAGIEDVMRAADAALYRAKAEGRNRVVTADGLPGVNPA